MPHRASATEVPNSEGQGAHMMVEAVSAPPKCTAFGVPKALIDSSLASHRVLAISAMTTNSGSPIGPRGSCGQMVDGC